MLKLIECPRDAMQGISQYIPAEKKADYINALLQVGFDTIDFGSFVSPKAIPQLRDTGEVIKMLDLTSTKTKLLAIIGNTKGAENALLFDEISYLGFPFSTSPTFLKLNINTTLEKAVKTIETINNQCNVKNKQLIVYLSMAFGNPYGDSCCIGSIVDAVNMLDKLGIKIIDLADTLGIGNPDIISDIFSKIIPAFPHIEFGLHLHTTEKMWYEKVHNAYSNGCRRFDSVMLGLGGCPMSSKELVGNLSTENLMYYINSNKIENNINSVNYNIALQKAQEIFSFL